MKLSHFQYLVAIAIPTSAVNNQRVYMALNFEAHYGLADADTFLDKFHHKVCICNPNIHCSQLRWNRLSLHFVVKFQYVGDTDSKRDIRAIANDDRSNHFTEKNNVYTRKNLYRILRQHIQS